MNAPDRSAETAAIVHKHRDLFGSDDRRRGILYYVCEGLNVFDGGAWGVLVKDDRGGFVPSDVIVYRPTMEHFDVLKGEPDGPSWQAHGPITNPHWRWARATTMLFAPGTGPEHPAPVDPVEPPAPIDPPPIDGAEALARLVLVIVEPIERLADSMSELATAINGARDVALELQRDGIKMRLR